MKKTSKFITVSRESIYNEIIYYYYHLSSTRNDKRYKDYNSIKEMYVINYLWWVNWDNNTGLSVPITFCLNL